MTAVPFTLRGRREVQVSRGVMFAILFGVAAVLFVLLNGQ